MSHTLFLVVVIAAFASIFGFAVHGKPSFEIEDGNCSSAVIGDLVYLHYVDRWPIPLVERSDVLNHHGDEKIYCVLVKSDQHEHKNSTVEITKGGVNHTFVELKIRSDAGYGYAYYIHVFGKNVSHGADIFT